jgi:hypothetical protein
MSSSGAGFRRRIAALVGVKYQTLASWIQKRRKTRRVEAAKPAALNWVEVAVECRTTSAPLTVQLPGGVIITVCDTNQAGLAGELLRSFVGPDTDVAPTELCTTKNTRL